MDELHSWDMQGDQMEGESSVNRSIIDELHYSDIQRDQLEGEKGGTRSIIDELHSSETMKWKLNVVLLEVPLMNFIFGISNQIK